MAYTLAQIQERIEDQAIADLTMLAIDLLIAPPEKGRAATAQVPWRMIDEGRAVLDAAGLDWRTTKRERRAARKSKGA